MNVAKQLNAAIFGARARKAAPPSKYRVTYYRDDGKTYACSSTFRSLKAANADVAASRANGCACSDPVKC